MTAALVFAGVALVAIIAMMIWVVRAPIDPERDSYRR